MQGGLRLFRLAGISVYLDWSLLIIFVLILASLGLGVFPQWHPDWSTTLSVGTAFIAAVLFLASVLAHEFSHAVVGRARGIVVRRITLFVFGGMAHMENEPNDWRGEFWMAIAGPITSLVLGVLFLVLAGFTAGPLSGEFSDPADLFARLDPLATLFFWLGPVNIMLGLFNLVPGFPLDGGRVLRAIIWGATGDMHRATRWASRGGQFFAWLLITAGVAMMLGLRVPIFGTGFVNGVWLAFIGWFLNSAAVASYRQLLIRETLQDVPVRRLMHTAIVAVPPDIALDEMVERYLFGGDQRAYPVMPDPGTLDGLVTLHDVRAVDREHWPRTRVSEVMVPVGEIVSVSPDDNASEALTRISNHGVNQLPVIDNGRVVGLVRREDILRWLALFGRIPGDE